MAKRGDAPAELVGFLTVGKSTQFGSLAEVYSEVAAGIHSADRCVIRHKGTEIQLLDPSNIIESVKDGKGREAAKSLQWPHCVT